MKARVKATGDIIEVLPYNNSSHFGYYQVGTSILYTKDALEFENVPNDPDYWTRLEHQYAGMAMQAIISKQTVGHKMNTITDLCRDIAHALVEELKKKEERK